MNLSYRIRLQYTLVNNYTSFARLRGTQLLYKEKPLQFLIKKRLFMKINVL